MPAETETLYGRAFAQEGNPIPRDHAVTVELLDSDGAVSESREFDRGDLTSDLCRFVGEFAASLAAEGMSGSIVWGPAVAAEGH